MPNERSSYDEQVVKMTFDNSNFDQNINDSIQALNRLDDKLGLLNKEDFSGIKNNLAELTQTFTIKGQIMFGVFARLGSEVVNLGIKFKNKLLGGLKDGLNEYNQIIDATQTIFANVKQSGASIDDVNKALDELNEYADLTIYNFGQMTRMIGMFTSAGVGLKKSVNTIKGLANAAALVGATPERAQIAWNAVARAMSSGTFSNLTWKSLELSNIAGKQFNDLITEVARANKVVGSSGKNIDQMLKKYGTLRETLREKWLTKDVFNEAMQIMAGELSKEQMIEKGYTEEAAERLRQIADAATEAATEVKTFKQLVETTGEAIGSGWAQSFRILIGDLNVAKKMFTRISYVVSDFIDNNARIRNDLFTKIVEAQDEGILKDLKTGRESFTQIIENMLAVVKTFLKAVKTGFLNIFPVERIAAAARKVLDIVEKFTRALVLNQEQLNGEEVLGWDTKNIDKVSDAIKNLIKFFRGLASAVDIAWMAISQPIKVIVDRIPFFKNFFNNTNSGLVGILNRLGQFGDKITVFRDAVKDTQIFGTVLALIIDNIDELGKEYPVLGAILSVFRGLKNAITKVSDAFKRLNIKPLNVLLGAFKMIVTSISKVLNFIFELLRDAKNRINWSWLDKPKQIIAGFLKKLNDYGQGLKTFDETLKDIGNSISKSFNKVGNAFNDFIKKFNIKKVTGTIYKANSNLNNTVTKTGSVLITIWEKIKNFVAPIGEFFAKVFDKSNFTLDNIEKKIALIGAGVGAAALTVSHLIKTVQKVKILSNFNELLEAGIDVVKAYQKEMNSKVILNVAAAIGILAASLAVLSFIPYENLENGLVIFTGFLSVLSITLTPIINSIARFNESIGQMKKALTGWDVLNNFIKQLGKVGKKFAKGVNAKLIGQAFKDLAISIFILTGAIAALVLLFKLDGKNTARAMQNIINLIIVLTGAVGILAGAITLLSKIGAKGKNALSIFSTFFTMAGVATVILSIAGAMAILVASLTAMSKIDTKGLRKNFEYFKETLKAIGIIAGVLVLITSLGGAFGNNSPRVVLGIAPIILSIAAAVALMAAALAKLSKLDPKTLKKAFNYIKEFLVTIGIFSSIITALVGAAQMFGSFGNHSTKVLLAMMVSLTAVVAALHLLGKAGPIDPTVMDTLRTLVIALGVVSAVVVAIGAVVTKANSTFSTSFASVFNKIAVGIGAVIASIGIMTAGIGALFASLSSISISNSAATKAANNVVVKLSIIAKTIREAISPMMKIFYDIGNYAGALFTAFNMGFINNIISTGEVYDEIAVKFVNIILDIIGKVVNALYQRRNDIKAIIKEAIDLIAAILTEVINDVFYRNRSTFQMKEDDLLKMLGFAGITVGGSSVLLKLASNFNTLSTSAKNFKNILKIGGVSDYFKPLFGDLKAGIDLFKEAKASGKEVGTAFGLMGEAAVDAAANVMAFAAALALIKVGAESLSIGWDQIFNGAPKYIRSDLETADDYIKAFFEDADFRAQSFVDGLTFLGEILVNSVMLIVHRIQTILGWIGRLFIGPYLTMMNGMADIVEMAGIGGDAGKEFAERLRLGTKAVNDAVEEWANASNNYKEIDHHFSVFDDPGDNVIDGAQKYADKVDEGTAIVVGSVQNLSNGLKTAWSWLENTGVTDAARNAIRNSMFQLGIDIGESASESVENVYKNFKVTDNSGIEKTIEINKDYLDIIIAEKENLKDLSREEQIRRINEIAASKGIQEDEIALARTYAAVLAQQTDQTKLTLTGMQTVQDKVNSALASASKQVLGDQTAAVDNYVTDYMNSTLLVTKIAEENKDKLVGMKKEEVAEYLKQEAIKQGLTEAEAEEAANHLMAIETGTTKTMEDLSSGELSYKIETFKSEYSAFEAMEKAKTEMAAAAKTEREKLAQNEYARVKEAYEKGYMTQRAYVEWTDKNRDKVTEYNNLKNAIGKIEGQYWSQIAKIKNSVTTNWKNQGLSNEEIANKWNQNVNSYKTAADEAKKSVGSTITTTIKQFLDKVKNGIAGDVDLSPWDYTTKKDNGSGYKDLDTKSAVDAAKDLKTNLEANRADLTPVFDLDQLQSDANKANGIVMSSLMAAQNASIGDYINKDSELNPFMKDRWQNVYNFTQNNYSPKALSRIDIYRQTQRQISMSRGF